MFFATTTLGSYKTSWTDRYVEPGSDWRDAYMDSQPQAAARENRNAQLKSFLGRRGGR